jgi:hypothetical protein
LRRTASVFSRLHFTSIYCEARQLSTPQLANVKSHVTNSRYGSAPCPSQEAPPPAPVFAHLARAIQACYFVQQSHLPINGAPGDSPCTHLTRAYMLHGAAFTPERGVSQRSRDLVLRLATLPPADGLVSSSPHCTSAASDYSRGFQPEYSPSPDPHRG